MADVVSLGSINVDFVRSVSGGEIARLADEHEWLPPAGATVSASERPDLPESSFQSFLGGKGANQAVAAAKAGADTALLGAVGPDHARHGALASIRQRGVTVTDVGRVEAPTGVAYVFVEDDGTNRILVIEGANGAVDEAYVDEVYEAVVDAECLLLQNEIPVRPMASLLDRLRGEPNRPTVVFNPSPVDGTRRLLGHDAVDVISVNETEYRELAAGLASANATVIRTQGADKVVVEGSETFRVAPPDVTPVDTTGAGDVFNGYVAARVAEGETIRSAVECAVAAAALSTEHAGAQASIPTRDDVLEFDRRTADVAERRY